MEERAVVTWWHGVLNYLHPVLIWHWLAGSHGWVYRIYRNIKSGFDPRFRRRRRLLSWVEQTAGREVLDLAALWKDGTILCDVIHHACPSSCAGWEDSRNKDTFRHAQALAYRCLLVQPAFTDAELNGAELTPNVEKRLFRYLQTLRQAISKKHLSRSLDDESDNEAHIADEYIARGMGLIMGSRNQRAIFYIYSRDGSSLMDFHIEVRGPGEDFGSLLVTQSESFHNQEGVSIPIEYRLTKEYLRISYQPRSVGPHELSVSRHGYIIPGSPFLVSVDEISEKQPKKRFNSIEWFSEDEERRQKVRQDKRKNAKVKCRIVDFVTEKMYLTDDGRLVKIPEDVQNCTTPAPPDFPAPVPPLIPELPPRATPSPTPSTDSKSSISRRSISPRPRKKRADKAKWTDVRPDSMKYIIVKPQKAEIRKVSDAASQVTLEFQPNVFQERCKRIVSVCDYLLKHCPRQTSLDVISGAASILQSGQPESEQPFKSKAEPIKLKELSKEEDDDDVFLPPTSHPPTVRTITYPERCRSVSLTFVNDGFNDIGDVVKNDTEENERIVEERRDSLSSHSASMARKSYRIEGNTKSPRRRSSFSSISQNNDSKEQPSEENHFEEFLTVKETPLVVDESKPIQDIHKLATLSVEENPDLEIKLISYIQYQDSLVSSHANNGGEIEEHEEGTSSKTSVDLSFVEDFDHTITSAQREENVSSECFGENLTEPNLTHSSDTIPQREQREEGNLTEEKMVDSYSQINEDVNESHNKESIDDTCLGDHESSKTSLEHKEEVLSVHSSENTTDVHSSTNSNSSQINEYVEKKCEKESINNLSLENFEEIRNSVLEEENVLIVDYNEYEPKVDVRLCDHSELEIEEINSGSHNTSVQHEEKTFVNYEKNDKHIDLNINSDSVPQNESQPESILKINTDRDSQMKEIVEGIRVDVSIDNLIEEHLKYNNTANQQREEISSTNFIENNQQIDLNISSDKTMPQNESQQEINLEMNTDEDNQIDATVKETCDTISSDDLSEEHIKYHKSNNQQKEEITVPFSENVKEFDLVSNRMLDIERKHEQQNNLQIKTDKDIQIEDTAEENCVTKSLEDLGGEPLKYYKTKNQGEEEMPVYLRENVIQVDSVIDGSIAPEHESQQENNLQNKKKTRLKHEKRRNQKIIVPKENIVGKIVAHFEANTNKELIKQPSLESRCQNIPKYKKKMNSRGELNSIDKSGSDSDNLNKKDISYEDLLHIEYLKSIGATTESLSTIKSKIELFEKKISSDTNKTPHSPSFQPNQFAAKFFGEDFTENVVQKSEHIFRAEPALVVSKHYAELREISVHTSKATEGIFFDFQPQPNISHKAHEEPKDGGNNVFLDDINVSKTPSTDNFTIDQPSGEENVEIDNDTHEGKSTDSFEEPVTTLSGDSKNTNDVMLFVEDTRIDQTTTHTLLATDMSIQIKEKVVSEIITDQAENKTAGGFVVVDKPKNEYVNNEDLIKKCEVTSDSVHIDISNSSVPEILIHEIKEILEEEAIAQPILASRHENLTDLKVEEHENTNDEGNENSLDNNCKKSNEIDQTETKFNITLDEISESAPKTFRFEVSNEVIGNEYIGDTTLIKTKEILEVSAKVHEAGASTDITDEIQLHEINENTTDISAGVIYSSNITTNELMSAEAQAGEIESCLKTTTETNLQKDSTEQDIQNVVEHNTAIITEKFTFVEQDTNMQPSEINIDIPDSNEKGREFDQHIDSTTCFDNEKESLGQNESEDISLNESKSLYKESTSQSEISISEDKEHSSLPEDALKPLIGASDNFSVQDNTFSRNGIVSLSSSLSQNSMINQDKTVELSDKLEEILSCVDKNKSNLDNEIAVELSTKINFEITNAHDLPAKHNTNDSELESTSNQETAIPVIGVPTIIVEIDTLPNEKGVVSELSSVVELPEKFQELTSKSISDEVYVFKEDLPSEQNEDVPMDSTEPIVHDSVKCLLNEQDSETPLIIEEIESLTQTFTNSSEIINTNNEATHVQKSNVCLDCSENVEDFSEQSKQKKDVNEIPEDAILTPLVGFYESVNEQITPNEEATNTLDPKTVDKGDFTNLDEHSAKDVQITETDPNSQSDPNSNEHCDLNYRNYDIGITDETECFFEANEDNSTDFSIIAENRETEVNKSAELLNQSSCDSFPQQNTDDPEIYFDASFNDCNFSSNSKSDTFELDNFSQSSGEAIVYLGKVSEQYESCLKSDITELEIQASGLHIEDDRRESLKYSQLTQKETTGKKNIDESNDQEEMVTSADTKLTLEQITQSLDEPTSKEDSVTDCLRKVECDILNNLEKIQERNTASSSPPVGEGETPYPSPIESTKQKKEELFENVAREDVNVGASIYSQQESSSVINLSYNVFDGSEILTNKEEESHSYIRGRFKQHVLDDPGETSLSVDLNTDVLSFSTDAINNGKVSIEGKPTSKTTVKEDEEEAKLDNIDTLVHSEEQENILGTQNLLAQNKEDISIRSNKCVTISNKASKENDKEGAENHSENDANVLTTTKSKSLSQEVLVLFQNETDSKSNVEQLETTKEILSDQGQSQMPTVECFEKATTEEVDYLGSTSTDLDVLLIEESLEQVIIKEQVEGLKATELSLYEVNKEDILTSADDHPDVLSPQVSTVPNVDPTQTPIDMVKGIINTKQQENVSTDSNLLVLEEIVKQDIIEDLKHSLEAPDLSPEEVHKEDILTSVEDQTKLLSPQVSTVANVDHTQNPNDIEEAIINTERLGLVSTDSNLLVAEESMKQDIIEDQKNSSKDPDLSSQEVHKEDISTSVEDQTKLSSPQVSTVANVDPTQTTNDMVEAIINTEQLENVSTDSNLLVVEENIKQDIIEDQNNSSKAPDLSLEEVHKGDILTSVKDQTKILSPQVSTVANGDPTKTRNDMLEALINTEQLGNVSTDSNLLVREEHRKQDIIEDDNNSPRGPDLPLEEVYKEDILTSVEDQTKLLSPQVSTVANVDHTQTPNDIEEVIINKEQKGNVSTDSNLLVLEENIMQDIVEDQKNSPRAQDLSIKVVDKEDMSTSVEDQTKLLSPQVSTVANVDPPQTPNDMVEVIINTEQLGNVSINTKLFIVKEKVKQDIIEDQKNGFKAPYLSLEEVHQEDILTRVDDQTKLLSTQVSKVVNFDPTETPTDLVQGITNTEQLGNVSTDSNLLVVEEIVKQDIIEDQKNSPRAPDLSLEEVHKDDILTSVEDQTKLLSPQVSTVENFDPIETSNDMVEAIINPEQLGNVSTDSNLLVVEENMKQNIIEDQKNSSKAPELSLEKADKVDILTCVEDQTKLLGPKDSTVAEVDPTQTTNDMVEAIINTEQLGNVSTDSNLLIVEFSIKQDIIEDQNNSSKAPDSSLEEVHQAFVEDQTKLLSPQVSLVANADPTQIPNDMLEALINTEQLSNVSTDSNVLVLEENRKQDIMEDENNSPRAPDLSLEEVHKEDILTSVADQTKLLSSQVSTVSNLDPIETPNDMVQAIINPEQLGNVLTDSNLLVIEENMKQHIIEGQKNSSKAPDLSLEKADKGDILNSVENQTTLLSSKVSTVVDVDPTQTTNDMVEAIINTEQLGNVSTDSNLLVVEFGIKQDIIEHQNNSSKAPDSSLEEVHQEDILAIVEDKTKILSPQVSTVANADPKQTPNDMVKAIINTEQLMNVSTDSNLLVVEEVVKQDIIEDQKNISEGPDLPVEEVHKEDILASVEDQTKLLSPQVSTVANVDHTQTPNDIEEAISNTVQQGNVSTDSNLLVLEENIMQDIIEDQKNNPRAQDLSIKEVDKEDMSTSVEDQTKLLSPQVSTVANVDPTQTSNDMVEAIINPEQLGNVSTDSNLLVVEEVVKEDIIKDQKNSSKGPDLPVEEVHKEDILTSVVDQTKLLSPQVSTVANVDHTQTPNDIEEAISNTVQQGNVSTDSNLLVLEENLMQDIIEDQKNSPRAPDLSIKEVDKEDMSTSVEDQTKLLRSQVSTVANVDPTQTPNDMVEAIINPEPLGTVSTDSSVLVVVKVVMQDIIEDQQNSPRAPDLSLEEVHKDDIITSVEDQTKLLSPKVSTVANVDPTETPNDKIEAIINTEQLGHVSTDSNLLVLEENVKQDIIEDQNNSSKAPEAEEESEQSTALLLHQTEDEITFINEMPTEVPMLEDSNLAQSITNITQMSDSKQLEDCIAKIEPVLGSFTENLPSGFEITESEIGSLQLKSQQANLQSKDISLTTPIQLQQEDPIKSLEQKEELQIKVLSLLDKEEISTVLDESEKTVSEDSKSKRISLDGKENQLSSIDILVSERRKEIVVSEYHEITRNEQPEPGIANLDEAPMKIKYQRSHEETVGKDQVEFSALENELVFKDRKETSVEENKEEDNLLQPLEEEKTSYNVYNSKPLKSTEVSETFSDIPENILNIQEQIHKELRFEERDGTVKANNDLLITNVPTETKNENMKHLTSKFEEDENAKDISRQSETVEQGKDNVMSVNTAFNEEDSYKSEKLDNNVKGSIDTDECSATVVTVRPGVVTQHINKELEPTSQSLVLLQEAILPVEDEDKIDHTTESQVSKTDLICERVCLEDQKEMKIRTIESLVLSETPVCGLSPNFATEYLSTTHVQSEFNEAQEESLTVVDEKVKLEGEGEVLVNESQLLKKENSEDFCTNLTILVDDSVTRNEKSERLNQNVLLDGQERTVEVDEKAPETGNCEKSVHKNDSESQIEILEFKEDISAPESEIFIDKILEPGVNESELLYETTDLKEMEGSFFELMQPQQVEYIQPQILEKEKNSSTFTDTSVQSLDHHLDHSIQTDPFSNAKKLDNQALEEQMKSVYNVGGDVLINQDATETQTLGVVNERSMLSFTEEDLETDVKESSLTSTETLQKQKVSKEPVLKTGSLDEQGETSRVINIQDTKVNPFDPLNEGNLETALKREGTKPDAFDFNNVSLSSEICTINYSPDKAELVEQYELISEQEQITDDACTPVLFENATDNSSRADESKPNVTDGKNKQIDYPEQQLLLPCDLEQSTIITDNSSIPFHGKASDCFLYADESSSEAGDLNNTKESSTPPSAIFVQDLCEPECVDGKIKIPIETKECKIDPTALKSLQEEAVESTKDLYDPLEELEIKTVPLDKIDEILDDVNKQDSSHLTVKDPTHTAEIKQYKESEEKRDGGIIKEPLNETLFDTVQINSEEVDIDYNEEYTHLKEKFVSAGEKQNILTREQELSKEEVTSIGFLDSLNELTQDSLEPVAIVGVISVASGNQRMISDVTDEQRIVETTNENQNEFVSEKLTSSNKCLKQLNPLKLSTEDFSVSLSTLDIPNNVQVNSFLDEYEENTTENISQLAEKEIDNLVEAKEQNSESLTVVNHEMPDVHPTTEPFAVSSESVHTPVPIEFKEKEDVVVSRQSDKSDSKPLEDHRAVTSPEKQYQSPQTDNSNSYPPPNVLHKASTSENETNEFLISEQDEIIELPGGFPSSETYREDNKPIFAARDLYLQLISNIDPPQTLAASQTKAQKKVSTSVFENSETVDSKIAKKAYNGETSLHFSVTGIIEPTISQEEFSVHRTISKDAVEFEEHLVKKQPDMVLENRTSSTSITNKIKNFIFPQTDEYSMNTEECKVPVGNAMELERSCILTSFKSFHSDSCEKSNDPIDENARISSPVEPTIISSAILNKRQNSFNGGNSNVELLRQKFEITLLDTEETKTDESKLTSTSRKSIHNETENKEGEIYDETVESGLNLEDSSNEVLEENKRIEIISIGSPCDQETTKLPSDVVQTCDEILNSDFKSMQSFLSPNDLKSVWDTAQPNINTLSTLNNRSNYNTNPFLNIEYGALLNLSEEGFKYDGGACDSNKADNYSFVSSKAQEVMQTLSLESEMLNSNLLTVEQELCEVLSIEDEEMDKNIDTEIADIDNMDVPYMTSDDVFAFKEKYETENDESLMESGSGINKFVSIENETMDMSIQQEISQLDGLCTSEVIYEQLEITCDQSSYVNNEKKIIRVAPDLLNFDPNEEDNTILENEKLDDKLLDEVCAVDYIPCFDEETQSKSTSSKEVGVIRPRLLVVNVDMLDTGSIEDERLDDETQKELEEIDNMSKLTLPGEDVEGSSVEKASSAMGFFSEDDTLASTISPLEVPENECSAEMIPPTRKLILVKKDHIFSFDNENDEALIEDEELTSQTEVEYSFGEESKLDETNLLQHDMNNYEFFKGSSVNKDSTPINEPINPFETDDFTSLEQNLDSIKSELSGAGESYTEKLLSFSDKNLSMSTESESSDFQMWSSNVEFGDRNDVVVPDGMDFDSIISAPNLDEALKKLEMHIQDKGETFQWLSTRTPSPSLQSLEKYFKDGEPCFDTDEFYAEVSGGVLSGNNIAQENKEQDISRGESVDITWAMPCENFPECSYSPGSEEINENETGNQQEESQDWIISPYQYPRVLLGNTGQMSIIDEEDDQRKSEPPSPLLEHTSLGSDRSTDDNQSENEQRGLRTECFTKEASNEVMEVLNDFDRLTTRPSVDEYNLAVDEASEAASSLEIIVSDNNCHGPNVEEDDVSSVLHDTFTLTKTEKNFPDHLSAIDHSFSTPYADCSDIQVLKTTEGVEGEMLNIVTISNDVENYESRLKDTNTYENQCVSTKETDENLEVESKTDCEFSREFVILETKPVFNEKNVRGEVKLLLEGDIDSVSEEMIDEFTVTERKMYWDKKLERFKDLENQNMPSACPKSLSKIKSGTVLELVSCFVENKEVSTNSNICIPKRTFSYQIPKPESNLLQDKPWFSGSNNDYDREKLVQSPNRETTIDETASMKLVSHWKTFWDDMITEQTETIEKPSIRKAHKIPSIQISEDDESGGGIILYSEQSETPDNTNDASIYEASTLASTTSEGYRQESIKTVADNQPTGSVLKNIRMFSDMTVPNSKYSLIPENMSPLVFKTNTPDDLTATVVFNKESNDSSENKMDCSNTHLFQPMGRPRSYSTGHIDTLITAVSQDINVEDDIKQKETSMQQDVRTIEQQNDSRIRFERAKQFFKHLEISGPGDVKNRDYRSMPRLDLVLSKTRKPSVDSDSGADTKPKKQRDRYRGRRKKKKNTSKTHSAPTSDTESSKRVRHGDSFDSFGGSVKSIKVSERFHVKDLFRDVSGNDGFFRGIPNRAAVLASLRSVDDVRALSPYQDNTNLKSSTSLGNIPSGFQEEYPYLPTTPINCFRPRSALEFNLIPRSELLDQHF